MHAVPEEPKREGKRARARERERAKDREREGVEKREEEENERKNAIVFATVHDKNEQSADPHQLFSS